MSRVKDWHVPECNINRRETMKHKPVSQILRIRLFVDWFIVLKTKDNNAHKKLKINAYKIWKYDTQKIVLEHNYQTHDAISIYISWN